jgi:hypothetical protein
VGTSFANAPQEQCIGIAKTTSWSAWPIVVLISVTCEGAGLTGDVRRLARIGSLSSLWARFAPEGRSYFFLACWPETWALEIEPSALWVVWWQVKVQVLLPRL